ncbi:hypothetical protein CBOM_08096 [Ceraceosorus bombacis]|uniref:Uncharacterized protein n=1 Tax=Ceraceosorus bombacis TaxID=401625 RepID=A0A0N7LAJ6_9BASI|nr:hypothetical protein CBOM_08096 [Ceraceosorus bombacis]
MPKGAFIGLQRHKHATIRASAIVNVGYRRHSHSDYLYQRLICCSSRSKSRARALQSKKSSPPKGQKKLDGRIKNWFPVTSLPTSHLPLAPFTQRPRFSPVRLAPPSVSERTDHLPQGHSQH